jgi:hypothetical protein
MRPGGSSALQRAVEQLGLAGVIGVGLLLFAAMYALNATMPAIDRVATLERELASASGSGAEPAQRAGGIDGELASFYGFFQPANSVSEVLAQVSAAAARSGVAFESAEYRLVRDAGVRLARYELTLPLRGTYAQVRSFVGTLLDELPQAALEDVAVKRDSVSSPGLEARLRLSIYMVLP